ncbi:poly(A) RNA polymerase GLD2 [Parasteatoda tepidariorum]|uniref:poly(A) RNA polymerase GLD2 n=1 Tax=Parasteatoda tepidariorum TaxID=114398 RepID=UPI00077FE1B2|nr:poly(A) RNA polymerase gld-2 homolog A [Parasteatoda tepidariorum]XP_042908284.1 poly(A) RNA polymerase gld-2 homolog A [Parasteatoda tepidariorum]
MFDMYHSLYPASWFITNQSQKTPLIFAYGDLPLISLDHVTALLPSFHQQPIFATSQIAVDIPNNMKRIPVNMLMQSMESVNNNCMPFLRRRNLTQQSLPRQISQDSLMESACGDSGMSSSRSSTPSSVETTGSSEIKRQPVIHTPSSTNMYRPRRKFEHGHNSQRQNMHQGYQNNPKPFPSNQKVFNAGLPQRKIPRDLKDEWFDVSLEIWNHYIKTRQREDMYVKKMNLRNAMHQVLSRLFPNCGLRVVGSSVNGLGTNTSDVDMCLILSTTEIDQQTEAMHILKYAQNELLACPFVKSTDLITAKVPILKVVEKYNNIQVDLNINNTVGIANTQLIGAYSQMDWRIPPLVLVIKKWAQDCKINNAKEMTLSSYSLVLMIIHYLQCGCEPPVLPCLQKLNSRRFETTDYWRPISFGDCLNFQTKNTQSLGSLLYGFFDYYTEKFDFSKDVMSVRLGCKLPKAVAMNFRSLKNKRGHWKFICIEEPFNRTNTACAVYDQDSFNRIMNAFKSTWLQLKAKKDLACVLVS